MAGIPGTQLQGRLTFFLLPSCQARLSGWGAVTNSEFSRPSLAFIYPRGTLGATLSANHRRSLAVHTFARCNQAALLLLIRPHLRGSVTRTELPYFLENFPLRSLLCFLFPLSFPSYYFSFISFSLSLSSFRIPVYSSAF